MAWDFVSGGGIISLEPCPPISSLSCSNECNGMRFLGGNGTIFKPEPWLTPSLRSSEGRSLPFMMLVDSVRKPTQHSRLR